MFIKVRGVRLNKDDCVISAEIDGKVLDITLSSITFETDLEDIPVNVTPFYKECSISGTFTPDSEVMTTIIKDLPEKQKFGITIRGIERRREFPKLLRALSRWLCDKLSIESGWIYWFGWMELTLNFDDVMISDIDPHPI